MVFKKFPLNKTDFENTQDDIGPNYSIVLNRGAALYDEDGVPLGIKHAVLAEWAHHKYGERIVCAVTVKSFLRDGKSFFSRDREKANTLLYCIMWEHQRLCHSRHSYDAVREIIEYIVDARDFAIKDLQLHHKDQIIDFMQEANKQMVATAKKGLQMQRDLAVQASVEMSRRIQTGMSRTEVTKERKEALEDKRM